MFWRKPSPSKIFKELTMLEVVLGASRARLDIALNIRRDRRTYMEYFYKVSVPSAMVGLPLTPLTMSNMFVNDTFIAMRRGLKKLRKIVMLLLRERYISPELSERLLNSIKEVEERMKTADSLPVERGIEELKESIDMMLAICAEVKAMLASRGISVPER